MKKALALLLAFAMIFALAACGQQAAPAPAAAPADDAPAAAPADAPADEPAAEPAPVEENLTEVQKIIKEAEGMTMEELARKAIEESNGQMLYGVGNSSRGKSALPLFIEYLQTIDPSYNLEFDWQQPKNNKIFDQLTANSTKAIGTFAVTLIQDGNQIESKMVQTGILDTFIPKEWAEANGVDAATYEGYLPLQTLNKVFMFNCTGDKVFDNVWDYVAEGEHGQFMDIDSEIVGKNFLYMLTAPQYAGWLKEAFDKLPAEEQAYFQPTINELKGDAEDLGLDENGAYALAWIKLWVGSYNAVTDDGPICKNLTDKSATDQFGLLVYSKLGYCHYMFVPDNSPLPWTACAFISYITCTVDGFSAWGKDMGGYSSNPTVAAGTEERYGHSQGGVVDGELKFPNKNDRGYDWWTTTGKLVLEDPAYCADAAFTVGSWIEMLDKYSAG